MLLPAVFLTVAVSLQDLPVEVVESFYWDCDTMFMKGELGAQDMYTCLTITETFQKNFPSKEAFREYWEENRRRQWDQRGYAWPANDT
jgi:hypothetical protein